MSIKHKPSLVILAAGMGSRYGGLKQIDGVGPSEEAIIDFSIYDAIRAGFGKVIFVIRRDIEDAFKKAVSNKWKNKIEVVHVFQEMDLAVPTLPADAPDRLKPWGTAHAVLAARPAVEEPFAVINADDYYGIGGYQKMADFLNNTCTPRHMSMLGYVIGRTLSDYGSVSRGVCSMDENNALTTVTERHKVRRENGQILFTENEKDSPLTEQNLVSMNYWGFYPTLMDIIHDDFQKYALANYQNPKSEFYIPLVINRMINEDGLNLEVIPNDDQWYGVTYKEDKPIVQKAMKGLVDAGKYVSPVWK